MAKESKRTRNARARKALETLKDTDLEKIDSGGFEELYVQTRDRFEELGIPEESGLRDELLEVVDRAILHYDPPKNSRPQEPEQAAEISQFIPDFAKGKRQFVGMAGKQKLYVTAEYDQLTISRLYGRTRNERITLFWRFNSAGRIEQLASKVFERNEEENLIEVPEGASRQADWVSAPANVSELPREIRVVNEGSYFQENKWKQYQNLVRYGHGAAKTIVSGLKNGDVRESDGGLAKNQMTLQRIVNDETALFILEQCTQIVPSFRMNGCGSGKITYKIAKPR